VLLHCIILEGIANIEMGGACGTHGKDETCIQYSGWKTLKGRDHSEDLGIDGKIILEWILG
jgi:hypothetical protein